MMATITTTAGRLASVLYGSPAYDLIPDGTVEHEGRICYREPLVPIRRVPEDAPVEVDLETGRITAECWIVDRIGISGRLGARQCRKLEEVER